MRTVRAGEDRNWTLRPPPRGHRSDCIQGHDIEQTTNLDFGLFKFESSFEQKTPTDEEMAKRLDRAANFVE